MKKLAILILLILLLLVGKSIYQSRIVTATSEKLEVSIDTTRSVSFRDSKYSINEEVILGNINLPRLIREIEKAKLNRQKKTSNIPTKVIDFLSEVGGEQFTLTNKDEEWRSGCVVLPDIQIVDDEIVKAEGLAQQRKYNRRKLVYLGTSRNITLLAYMLGGIGVSERILIIEHDEENIVDFWCGGTLIDLTTKKDLINHLRKYVNTEWELNTNIIYF